MIQRVAVVDDMETARMFVQRCLAAIGLSSAEFRGFKNGQEALDALRLAPFDLVVTDLTMPVMDGEALLAAIKADQAIQRTPVVVISSAGNPAREKSLLDAGALGVLAKPFSPADLYRMLYPLLIEAGS